MYVVLSFRLQKMVKSLISCRLSEAAADQELHYFLWRINATLAVKEFNNQQIHLSGTMSDFPLPIIDLVAAKSDKQAEAQKVVHALENSGFLYIDGIQDIDKAKLLQACKWFFGKPQEEKNKLMRQFWAPDNENVYRGYFPVVEQEPSRKEGFEFARDIKPGDPSVKPGNWFYERSVWPDEDGTFPFKEFLQHCYNVLHNASLDILRLAAVGLGIDEFAFDDIFADKPCTTFRLMHYPPWDGKPPENAKIEDGKVVTTPDHTDSNFLTLLYTFEFTGLEVMHASGDWVAVPPRKDAFVMNIGDVFSRMMGGRFKATRHRVLDIGVDRFSVPFFLEPAFDGDIGENFMSKATGKGPEHVVEHYGPWMVKQVKHIKKYFEYKVLPEI